MNMAMTSTHMTMSEASRSNQQYASSPPVADSIFRATNSSYHLLQASQAPSVKADLKVFTLPNEPVEEGS